MPQTIPAPIGGGGGGGPFANLFPLGGDGLGSVGTAGNRWSEIVGEEVTSGDFHLRAVDDSAHWTLIEHIDHIEAINVKTGERFEIQLKPKE